MSSDQAAPLSTPHDLLFKGVFSEPAQAAAWFRGALPPEVVVEVGTQLTATGESNGQAQIVRIHEVLEEEVIIDFNHPLAGQELTFEVTVVGVRDATEEEQAHGHPHGARGHKH